MQGHQKAYLATWSLHCVRTEIYSLTLLTAGRKSRLFGSLHVFVEYIYIRTRLRRWHDNKAILQSNARFPCTRAWIGGWIDVNECRVLSVRGDGQVRRVYDVIRCPRREGRGRRRFKHYADWKLKAALFISCIANTIHTLSGIDEQNKGKKIQRGHTMQEQDFENVFIEMHFFLTFSKVWRGKCIYSSFLYFVNFSLGRIAQWQNLSPQYC